MIDDFWWDIREQLKLEIERDPTFEEVEERMDAMFQTTKKEEVEFYNRKVYGKI